mmetsp:Transcript_152353/g.488750  ORF Transcript_152353/g.488750 Transcript_152353/m.488750 type:complete len:127 (+) Transcript_152353:86-466(+)
MARIPQQMVEMAAELFPMTQETVETVAEVPFPMAQEEIVHVPMITLQERLSQLLVQMTVEVLGLTAQAVFVYVTKIMVQRCFQLQMGEMSVEKAFQHQRFFHIHVEVFVVVFVEQIPGEIVGSRAG